MKEEIRFLLGAILVAPIKATEDLLRYAGVPISTYGFTKDEYGKGIFEIWKESKK